MHCKAKWYKVVCTLSKDPQKQADACDENWGAANFCEYADWTEHVFDGDIMQIDQEWDDDFEDKYISIYTGEKRKRLLVRGLARNYEHNDCGIGNTYFEYVEIDGEVIFPLERLGEHIEEGENEIV